MGRAACEMPQQVTADLHIRIIQRPRDDPKVTGNSVQQVDPFHFVRVRFGRDQPGDRIHFPTDLPQVAGLQRVKYGLRLSGGIGKLYLHFVHDFSSDGAAILSVEPTRIEYQDDMGDRPTET